jgi:hypothetical protein
LSQNEDDIEKNNTDSKQYRQANKNLPILLTGTPYVVYTLPENEILEDYNAKCFLHELDHLEGITYKDRTSALKWAMAIKKSKPKRKFK